MSNSISFCTRRIAARVCVQGRHRIATQFARRHMASASAAVQKLGASLNAELAFEKENHKASDGALKVPSGWELIDKKGDVNMELKKHVGAKMCKIEWQAMAPYDAPEYDDPENPEAKDNDEDVDRSAEFTITIENGDSGCTIFCQTQPLLEGAENGENAERFIIGNLKVWSDSVEKDSPTSYNGPEFEDLEDKLQESISEWLGEFGINDTVMDYIDASGLDKEQALYVEWLQKMKTFIK